jgi:hypothetical protein
VFEQEFEHVTTRLSAMSLRSPIGTIYRIKRGQTIRRVLLSKTRQHVYYSIDENSDTVVIRAIWGARRGRTPRL